MLSAIVKVHLSGGTTGTVGEMLTTSSWLERGVWLLPGGERSCSPFKGQGLLSHSFVLNHEFRVHSTEMLPFAELEGLLRPLSLSWLKSKITHL